MEAFCAIGVVSGFGWGSVPGPLFDVFPSFMSLAPTVSWVGTLQPRLADGLSKSSRAWLLPSGYLIGSHPPLLILGGTEPPWMGASIVPCFSCASAAIPPTRRAYTAESGAAVIP